MIRQERMQCKTCRRDTLHAKGETLPFFAGLVLTVLTCGGFILIWPFLAVAQDVVPWTCQNCGTKRVG